MFDQNIKIVADGDKVKLSVNVNGYTIDYHCSGGFLDFKMTVVKTENGDVIKPGFDVELFSLTMGYKIVKMYQMCYEKHVRDTCVDYSSWPIYLNERFHYESEEHMYLKLPVSIIGNVITVNNGDGTSKSTTFESSLGGVRISKEGEDMYEFISEFQTKKLIACIQIPYFEFREGDHVFYIGADCSLLDYTKVN